MTPNTERLTRPGLAALAGAVAGLLLITGYHPCEGIDRLLLLPPIVAGIALAASLPEVRPRVILLSGAAATTVIAIAIGLDYSSSGSVNPDGGQCELVRGFAGFLLGAIFSVTFALTGLLTTAFVVWLVRESMRWRAQSSRLPQTDA